MVIKTNSEYSENLLQPVAEVLFTLFIRAAGDTDGHEVREILLRRLHFLRNSSVEISSLSRSNSKSMVANWDRIGENFEHSKRMWY